MLKKLFPLRRLTLRATLTYISAASAVTASVSSQGREIPFRNAAEVLGEPFPDALVRIQRTTEAEGRAELVRNLVQRISDYGRLLMQDSTVYFVYHGNATKVTVPSDLNGWDASADAMDRLEGTDLFYRTRNVHPAARFEYKLVVDSTWSLDPLNTQTAIGGYGPNSEAWMPGYHPSAEIAYRPNIPHGKIDTLEFKSSLLGRTHPVFVYLPPTYPSLTEDYPSIWVTDGGEYLSLALMNNVLDNLLAEARIRPVIAIFIDPRTNVRDSGTSKRMQDYAMRDTFITALTTELAPRLLRKYRIIGDPRQTAIMGASLGGLIATYAAVTRPDMFGLVAAQSPAYWWNQGAIFQLVRSSQKEDIRFYIDTGTIRDARAESLEMKAALLEQGYEVMYAEYPEGHNWVNWRARIGDILTFFWGTR
jgi:enterochelin esterase family protein